jgi:hypothetical protein
MPVRRSGIVGSALATSLLGTFLYRPASTLSSSGGPETGESRAALSTTKGVAKKKSNAQTRSPGKSEKSGTFAEEGPWIASQQHFAGLAPSSCVLAPLKHKKQTPADRPCGPPSTVGNDLRQWCIPDAERTKIKTMIAMDSQSQCVVLFWESPKYMILRRAFQWIPCLN